VNLVKQEKKDPMEISLDKKPLVHVFICESCGFKNADETYCHPDTAKILRKRVKELCAQQAGKTELRINGSACLGRCETGINAVIYPEGKHLQFLQEGDEHRLAQLALEAVSKAKLTQCS
jgi:predicted metal-binding protein